MNSNLRVLVTSDDRSLLREAAYLLEEFGYEPVCHADAAAALRWRGAAGCHFLIVDHDALAGDYDQIEYAKRRRDADYLQVYLLCSDLSAVDVESAVESGVDDFLQKPLNNGEVLARLRAGARHTEFQHRSCRQQWHDPLTGLASRTALLEQLQKQTGVGRRARPITMAVLELDLFDNFVAMHGQDLGNEVLCTVGRLMDDACTAGQIAARLRGGRFAVLLVDHSLEKAAKWAEQLRHAIGELELARLAPLEHVTASVGLSAAEEHLSPLQVIERAEAALAEAHRCGRNCLVTCGEFAEERAAWNTLVQSGNPFESTLARDVMTPLTLTLHAEDSLATAAELFEQTMLDWLPVADERDRWTGLVERRAVVDSPPQGDGGATLVKMLASTDVAQLPDSAAFSSVMDCFVRAEEPVVVITRGGRPAGYIGREQFLGLVRPMSPDMFTVADDEFSTSTEFLVVPDLVPL